MICATRVDPDTGRVIRSEVRKDRLEKAKDMLKKYKGKEPKLLMKFLRKYKVPKEEGRKIMAM